jgi:Rad3-related DNA helicase
MDTALPKITQMIDKIMFHHQYDRGIIHTTSYRQANYILQNISETNRARLKTTEGISNRTELMKKHNSSDASVLISPSLHQGIDLKDESSRFQIIMKVPYPDLSQKRTKIKLQRDREWYDWQTALRLVQTYGRSIRSEDDHATTYLLDTNFTYFVKKKRNLFPKFFLEALRGNSQALPSITDY